MTTPSGEAVSGVVGQMDDFLFRSRRQRHASNDQRTAGSRWRAAGSACLSRRTARPLTDKNMHDVVAYMETPNEAPCLPRVCPRDRVTTLAAQQPGWVDRPSRAAGHRQLAELQRRLLRTAIQHRWTKISAGKSTPESRRDVRVAPASATAFDQGHAIMIGGVMYVTVPDHVWRSTRAPAASCGTTLGVEGGSHRQPGVAIAGDSLFFETPDCHLVSLGVKDGKERWRKLSATSTSSTTVGCAVVVKNHVIAGVSGDDLDIPGYVQSHDREAGKCNGAGMFRADRKWARPGRNRGRMRMR